MIATRRRTVIGDFTTFLTSGWLPRIFVPGQTDSERIGTSHPGLLTRASKVGI